MGSINLQHVKVRSDKLANGSGFIHLKMTTLPEWTLLKVPLHSNTARWVSLKSMQKIGNKSCKKSKKKILQGLADKQDYLKRLKSFSDILAYVDLKQKHICKLEPQKLQR